MKCKKHIVLIVLVMITSPLFPNESDQILHRYLPVQGSNLVLIPDLPEADSVKTFFKENRPSYAVEMLYSFPGKGSVDWKELYFNLRGISKLEEITYFSEHIQKYRKMFKKAYVVSSVSDRKKMPDYRGKHEYKSTVVYDYLDEVVLGKGVYKAEYTIAPNAISIVLQNVTNLSRGIRLIDKNNFYIKFIVYRHGPDLKAYIFGAYTLENEFIVRKVLKYPYSTLAKRVYIIFVKLIDGFYGADLPLDFPQYLRE